MVLRPKSIGPAHPTLKQGLSRAGQMAVWGFYCMRISWAKAVFMLYVEPSPGIEFIFAKGYDESYRGPYFLAKIRRSSPNASEGGWSRHPESNRGPRPYHGRALPTEL